MLNETINCCSVFFLGQVLSLTKMLKHATTSSAKDNQQEEESKVHDLVGLYEAKSKWCSYIVTYACEFRSAFL